jgi:hypothetical protein
MTNTVLDAISSVVNRMREEFGVEPRVGQEWEFQLLNNQGEALDKYEMDKQLKELLDGLPFEKVYKERAYGMHEVTTQALPPEEAAKAMKQIQEKIATYAKENDYHLSACPTIAGKNGLGKSGSAGFHNNISLQNINGEKSILAINDLQSEVDTFTAHLADKTNRMAQETAAWSYHSPEDFVRIQEGDGVAKAFRVGAAKRGGPGIEIRNNDIVPDPLDILGGAEGYTARLENRYASARIDPEVATFRDVVAQYDALKTRGEISGGSIRVDTLENLGAVPLSMEEVQAIHLQEGSILHKYVGDLYDADTLKLIDDQGRNPWILQHESTKFQFKAPPPAVTNVINASSEEITENIGKPHIAAPATSTTASVVPDAVTVSTDIAPSPVTSVTNAVESVAAPTVKSTAVIDNVAEAVVAAPSSSALAKIEPVAAVTEVLPENVPNKLDSLYDGAKVSSQATETTEEMVQTLGKAKSSHLATVGNLGEGAVGIGLMAHGAHKFRQEMEIDEQLQKQGEGRSWVAKVGGRAKAAGEMQVGAYLTGDAAMRQATGKGFTERLLEGVKIGAQAARSA